MRRRFMPKSSLLPKMSLNHRRINSEPLNNDNILFGQYSQSIQKYQKQLNRQQKSRLINFRVHKKPSINLIEGIDKTKLIKNLAKATQDISTLKQQISKNNLVEKNRTGAKLEQLIAKLADSLSHQQIQSKQSFQQPIFYPVPMPFPMHLPQLSQNHLQSRFNRNTSRQQSFYDKNYQTSKKENRRQRIRKNTRKWRKVGNCILFILYLKRFNTLAQNNRQITFNKNINKIKNTLVFIRKSIIQCIDPVLKTLIIKKQVQFDLLDSDSKQIIRQKIISIRKCVAMILQCLLVFAKQNRNKVQFIEAVYYLCKHGNYSNRQPLLTREQMEQTCISPAFEYVSAQKYLQKAALINVIFLKLLLFNSLLSLQKMDSQFAEEIISNNLYVISSVAYQLFLDVQDQYMLKVPKSYKIGNYEQFTDIRILQSIVIGKSEKRPGQLISGLKSQAWIKKYFNFRGWHQQKESLMTIIDIFDNSMAQLHRKLIKKCY